MPQSPQTTLSDRLHCDPPQARIAVAGHSDTVAPLFGSARALRVWSLDRAGHLSEQDPILLDDSSALKRVNRLRDEGVDVLLCQGIEQKTHLLCEAWGIRVIRGVVGDMQHAVAGFAAGAIPAENRTDKFYDHSLVLYSCDPRDWTRSLFTSFGWTVDASENPSEFPVDLVAERACPVCGKPVRVAICSGARSYCVDQELQEFTRVTGDRYHAGVFVHHRSGVLKDWGREHGVQVLDPVDIEFTSHPATVRGLSPLDGPVRGHDALLDQPGPNEESVPW